jgi:hypothetical protein
VTQPEARELVSFLVNCSRVSLDNFLIIQQSRASNLERDLRDAIRNLVEKTAFIELAHLLREHGEEIVGATPAQGAAELSTSPLPIPLNWWKWILRRRDLSVHEKIVALSIKANEIGGVCRSFVSQIARDASVSTKTVQRSLKSLRKKGLLEVTRTGPHALRIRGLLVPSSPGKEGTAGPHGGLLDPKEGSVSPTLSEDLRMSGGSPLNSGGNGVDKSRRLEREILKDGDKLTRFLLGKFKGKTDRMGRCFDVHDVRFAIRKIYNRANTPPGSLKYWTVAVEKFFSENEEQPKNQSDREIWNHLVQNYAPPASTGKRELAKKAGAP